MRLLKNKGFTLIELLVVITLIGILAIAVLSAINPIEQVNKARDAGRRGDSAQLLKAIERYYASTEEYPWMSNSRFGDNRITTVGAIFSSAADKAGAGICYGETLTATDKDETGCSVGDVGERGILIDAEEFKAQFAKRKGFRDGANMEDFLYVLKPALDPSVSVCFIPSSKSTRNEYTKLKQISVTGASPENDEAGTPNASGIVSPCSDPVPTWEDTAASCFVCIPEE